MFMVTIIGDSKQPSGDFSCEINGVWVLVW
jgi:hypothetical protein